MLEHLACKPCRALGVRFDDILLCRSFLTDSDIRFIRADTFTWVAELCDLGTKSTSSVSAVVGL